MIAKQDKAISEAAYTIYKISEDERIRQECEAREMFLQKERAEKRQKRALQRELKKAKEQLSQQSEQLSQKDEQITRLQARLKELEKQNT